MSLFLYFLLLCMLATFVGVSMQVCCIVYLSECCLVCMWWYVSYLWWLMSVVCLAYHHEHTNSPTCPRVSLFIHVPVCLFFNYYDFVFRLFLSIFLFYVMYLIVYWRILVRHFLVLLLCHITKDLWLLYVLLRFFVLILLLINITSSSNLAPSSTLFCY